jgi:hypothetical protein
MSVTVKLLSDYINDVRRLLHDASAKYWQDSELIDYINEARNRVVADTGCNRTIQTGTVAAGVNSYAMSSFGNNDTFDVLNIRLQWGSMWYQLDYHPYGELATLLLSWQTWQQRPIAFSVYGQQTIFVGPVPDQTYNIELDTVVAPPALANYTDADIIAFPYLGLPKFYAAYLAKFKEQSYDEATKFEMEYVKRLKEALRSSFTRRIASMYQ